MSIKVGRKHHDMRIAGRIVGVRSTKQSVGIIVGGFCPQHLIYDSRSKKSFNHVCLHTGGRMTLRPTIACRRKGDQ